MNRECKRGKMGVSAAFIYISISIYRHVESKEMSKRSRKRIQPRLRRAKRRCTTRPAGREGRPTERGLRRRGAPSPRPRARHRQADAKRGQYATALYCAYMSSFHCLN